MPGKLYISPGAGPLRQKGGAEKSDPENILKTHYTQIITADDTV